MKFVMQDKFGKEFGNCWGACIATLLEIPLEEIPNLNIENQTLVTNNWLASLGYGIFECQPLTKETMESLGLSTYHIITGDSPRGNFKHAVIGFNGIFIHDPHPDQTGLRSIDSNAFLIKICK